MDNKPPFTVTKHRADCRTAPGTVTPDRPARPSASEARRYGKVPRCSSPSGYWGLALASWLKGKTKGTPTRLEAGSQPKRLITESRTIKPGLVFTGDYPARSSSDKIVEWGY